MNRVMTAVSVVILRHVTRDVIIHVMMDVQYDVTIIVIQIVMNHVINAMRVVTIIIVIRIVMIILEPVRPRVVAAAIGFIFNFDAFSLFLCHCCVWQTVCF